MRAIEEFQKYPLPPPTPSNTIFVKNSPIKWIKFKQGAYNQLFIGESNQNWWIQKFAKKVSPIGSIMSEPSRFLRKNSLINQTRLPAFINKGFHIRLERPPQEGNLEPYVVYLYPSRNENITVCYLKDKDNLIHQSIEECLYYDLWHHTKHALRIDSLPLIIENALLDFLKLKRDSLVMPFVGREIPNDSMIVDYVLDVYKKTRNILLDACIPGNLLIYENEIICVDFDCVFEKGSVVTEEFLSGPQNVSQIYKFLKMHLIRNINPMTANACLTLLYLEKHIPIQDIRNEMLSPDNFFLIDQFRTMKVKLTLEHLLKIQLLTEAYPLFKKYKQYITPHFLSYISTEQPPQSKDVERLFKHQTSEILVKSKQLNPEFNFFRRHNHPLTHQHHREIALYHDPK